MMKNSDFQWLKWITEIQAIAQSGLAYSENMYDIERYKRLIEIVADVAANFTSHPTDIMYTLFSQEKGYATPKLDVRAFVREGPKILLVKERADGLWALPGGWADVNESPSEAIIRETKEETGFDVATLKLLALWDKLKHDHPPQWPHVYKCFFLCERLGGEATANMEISEVDFFDINALPPLSTHRVTENQLTRLFELASRDENTQFD